MARPSAMLICGRHPRHLYVANRICQSVDPVVIVQESGQRWSYQKVRSKLRPSEIAAKVWRTLRDRRRYADGREARFFFGDAPPRLDRHDLVKVVPHINDPEVVELARRHRPDIIAVMGSSLIKGELLRMGRRGIVNLHGGINPHYRGSDGIFWALYEGKPEMAGMTVHFIDASIDTGDIIAHVLPGVGPDDDEMTILWRGFRAAAEVYAEAIQRLAAGEPLGVPIGERGRLFLLRHRTAVRDAELALRMRRGLMRGVSVRPETRWFSPTHA
ncbi:formyl transferase [Sorangium sp. So ce1078]|uniref:formyl transferase n=1 Tax=Sorangium sp. So ce1078 TaxID=3133329 RepID=UPI003F5E4F7E